MSKVDNYYVRHFHTDSLANGVLRDSSEIYTNKNLYVTGYEITLRPLNEGRSIVENMTTDNYITLMENGGVADTYCFPKGSYELSVLVAEINELLNNRDDYYCELSVFVENTHFGVASFNLEVTGSSDLYFDFSKAPDLRAIFSFPELLVKGETIGDSVVDITNGLQNIQFYCSLLQACSTRIGNNDNTLFCNFLIEDPFVTCNNYTEHLKIPVYNLAHNVVFNVRTMGSTNSLARLQCSCDITLYLATFNDYFEHPLELGSVAFNESRGVFVDQMQVMNFEVTKARESVDLDSTLRLPENSYITRVNVMIKGEIYNVAEDQVLRINNSDLVIPKGSWTLDSLLGKLNESSAMFSLIEENKDAFRISISEYFNINFEGAQIIKKILGLGDAPDTLVYNPGGLYYPVDSTNCEYYLEVDGLLLPMRMLTASEPLSEKAFFNLFISDVCDALGIETIAPEVIDPHYYEYNFSGSVETINVITETCENPLTKFHWFKGWDFRNKDANCASLIIPRYGSFYFNEEVTFDMLNEKVYYFMARSGNKEYELTINYVDSNDVVTESKKYDLRGIPDGVYSARDFYEKIWRNAGISSKYDKSYYYRGHGFFQYKDSGYKGFIRFSGPSEFIKLFHLPTRKTTGSYFEMYLTNSDHKIDSPDLTGETLTITYEKYPNQPLTATFSGPTDIVEIFDQVRSLVNDQIVLWGYSKTQKHEFLNYNCPMYRLIIPNDATITNNLKYKYSGSLIDKGYIRGLHTEYKCEQCRAVLCGPTSYQLNLGYTSMEGLHLGLQNLLNTREYASLLQENMEISVDAGTIIARNPSALTTISVNNFNVVAYPDSSRNNQWCDRTEIFSPFADVQITVDNYQLNVLNVNTGESVAINCALGFYDFDSLVTKLNGYLFGKGINIQFTKAQTGYSAISNVKYSLSGGLKDLLGITSNEEQTGFFIKYRENATLGESHGDHEYVCNDLFDITNGMDHLDIYSNCIRGLGVNNKLCGLVIDNLNLNYTSLQTLLPCKNTLNEIEFELKDANGNDYAFSGCCDVALTVGSVAK